jgi:hypothetical protein
MRAECESENEVELAERTIAYMFIKTLPGEAENVAKQASHRIDGYDPEKPLSEQPGYSWENPQNPGEMLGVRLSVVITCPYHVLLGIRVLNNFQLGELVQKIKLIVGIANPDSGVVTSSYKDGGVQQRVKNGPP